MTKMTIQDIPANKNFYRASKKEALAAMVDFIKYESLWGERGHNARVWLFGNNLLALHLNDDFITLDAFWSLKVQIKQRFNIELDEYSVTVLDGTLKIAFHTHLNYVPY